jgi:HAD superfamily hydrolase (TIGR01509 family)
VISWDVDGTLYSLSAMVSKLAWLGAKRLLNSEVRRTAREFVALHRFRLQMADIRAVGGALPAATPHERASDRLQIEQRWYGEAIRRVGLRNGVRETLNRFRQAGLVQVAVSDYDCSYKLSALRLEGAFDHVYAGERLGYLKPSPDLFTTVTDQLRIKPTHLLHIGDRRDRDGVAASAAGCNVLILGEDFRSYPDLLANIPQ